ncbi:hypothetical protein KMT30_30960 [Streptomyces sp. IBSBF 2953]|uniref:hypothetical protein n=1 Tax=Streptomyces TaxID=1883 RepID=UPI00211A3CEE|nr:hypothetical protein [Streptomyces scabiei]MCQ9183389.1 hypothetical protein [Streptomyces hayashii]MDX3119059.1 hypothetical protein [Streptomyces scabiei]
MTGRRLRASHPVVVLRRLRAGVLAVLAVTTLLCLVAADRAEEQIDASRRTQEAVDDIRQAHEQATRARAALEAVSRIEDPVSISLTGAGADFANAAARISSHLTSATEGNGAGKRGLSHIQFVQGQLATSVQMANAAVLDGAQAVGKVGESLHAEREHPGGESVRFTGGLEQSLLDLQQVESDAKQVQLDSDWRDRRLLWPLFMTPLAVMLLLVCATGRIVARRFRRYPSPALVLVLPATASVDVLMCVLRPLNVAVALPVLAAAGALTYLAYRPRLAEYRFPRS